MQAPWHCHAGDVDPQLSLACYDLKGMARSITGISARGAAGNDSGETMFPPWNRQPFDKGNPRQEGETDIKHLNDGNKTPSHCHATRFSSNRRAERIRQPDR